MNEGRLLEPDSEPAAGNQLGGELAELRIVSHDHEPIDSRELDAIDDRVDGVADRELPDLLDAESRREHVGQTGRGLLGAYVRAGPDDIRNEPQRERTAGGVGHTRGTFLRQATVVVDSRMFRVRILGDAVADDVEVDRCSHDLPLQPRACAPSTAMCSGDHDDERQSIRDSPTASLPHMNSRASALLVLAALTIGVVAHLATREATPLHENRGEPPPAGSDHEPTGDRPTPSIEARAAGVPGTLVGQQMLAGLLDEALTAESPDDVTHALRALSRRMSEFRSTGFDPTLTAAAARFASEGARALRDRVDGRHAVAVGELLLDTGDIESLERLQASYADSPVSERYAGMLRAAREGASGGI